MKQQLRDAAGIAEGLCGVGRDSESDFALIAAQQPPADKHGHAQHARNSDQGCNVAALRFLFLARVQQHDDEDKQHHDCSGVDDDLHRSNELRAEQ